MKSKLINVLFALCGVLLVTGCVTKKQWNKICNECKNNSVNYDSIYIRDTLVKLDSDSAYFEALLECDSLGNVKIAELNELQGRLISLNGKLKNNKIKVTGKTDTIRVYVKGNTEFRYKYREVQVPVTIYKEYWWKWPLIIWAALSTVIVLITQRKTIFKLLIGL